MRTGSIRPVGLRDVETLDGPSGGPITEDPTAQACHRFVFLGGRASSAGLVAGRRFSPMAFANESASRDAAGGATESTRHNSSRGTSIFSAPPCSSLLRIEENLLICNERGQETQEEINSSVRIVKSFPA